MEIEGLSHSTLLTLISEVGLDGIKKFPQPNTLQVGSGYHPTIK